MVEVSISDTSFPVSQCEFMSHQIERVPALSGQDKKRQKRGDDDDDNNNKGTSAAAATSFDKTACSLTCAISLTILRGLSIETH